MNEHPQTPIPQYQCHKKVWALQIESIEPNGTIYFMDHSYPPYAPELELFARGKPEPGDYFIQYEDGYWSWSPKKAFEEGYTLIEGT